MIGKLLTRLFALFGITLTCVACYGVEYAEFNPNFGASGRVVDSEERPIEGIKAQSGDHVTYTDANGRFHVYSTTPHVILTDVDGEANGGEFSGVEVVLGSSGSDVELGDIILEHKN